MAVNDVYITSLGTFFPGPPITNDEMESYLGYVGGKPSRYRALVLRQNRIKTRHYAIATDGRALHSNAEMAAAAILDAVSRSEVLRSDIGYLATSTTIGDFLLPGLASNVHALLGIDPIEIANFQSVCVGSLMAMKAAYTQLKAGEHTCATVSGSEFSSRFFRPGFYEHTDVFGSDGEVPFQAEFLRFTLSDGAGAAILETKPNERRRSLKIRWIDIRSYADRFEPCMLAGGVRTGDTWKYWGDFGSAGDAARAGALLLTQDVKLLKRMLPIWISHFVDLIGLGMFAVDEVDHYCCHYSAHSLRDEATTYFRAAGALIDETKWFSNLATRGNMGSASIFALLEELYAGGRLRPGETILCQVPESGRALSGLMLLEVV